MDVFAAHILRENPEDPKSAVLKVQTVEEHARGVAEKAGAFAEPFHGKELAVNCGLAHDIGKYSKGFQRRIWEDGPKVDHSSAGAQVLMEKKTFANLICAYCVAGHHSGLMDLEKLEERLGKHLKNGLAFQSYKKEIELLPVSNWSGTLTENVQGFSLAFFTRMLFSCLVDADFLDTEAFMRPEMNRGNFSGDLSPLKEKLESYICEKSYLSGDEGINLWRSGILRRCIEQGKEQERGVYTLTVPTGGGKTISSLAFALNHAVKNRQERIIYVVPFCAIIDQTVDEFEKVLGSENVLAHYSEADFAENEEYESKRLATENWDMPVVVTTAVQFFESLFSSKPSKCRKLHNIANSVIVFDEAQTIPREYLDPCICAISELALNYKATCILCTATQPALKPRFGKYYPGLEIREISEHPDDLYQRFKRVSYEILGKQNDEQMSVRLAAHRQVLCIVATRAQAKNVFDLMPEEGRFHLSTLMTPEHRKRVIRDIRERLKEGEICRVVSTSLIEAGVDLDFPVVYRSMAGLDSIIQAGGRCNREGRIPGGGTVYVFEPEAKYRIPDVMKRPAELTKWVVANSDDLAKPEMIEGYFAKLYGFDENLYGAMDQKEIISGLQEGTRHKDMRFEKVAHDFHFISDQGVRIIFIPNNEESRRMAELIKMEKAGIERGLFRKISKYCVNVYERQYKELLPALYVVDDSLAILELMEEYNVETGLKFRFEGGDGSFC
ncbi:MAG: CRISPR-associated helicase Cas3' [Lachnospiraceae bacterium]|nr:CRISPR-associated helicase Cas3' [Lachnospiraceae bacterium]